MRAKTRIPAILTLTALSCLALVACDESSAPLLPSRIVIQSGDDQFSKHGTQLPERLEVRLFYPGGTPAGGFDVDFQIVELGGSLSASTVTSNGNGRASVRLTLPDQNGTVRVRASLELEPNVFTDFTATSSDFYCPEDDPTFVKKFSSSGIVFHDLFLFTAKSSLFPGAGLIRVKPGQGLFEAIPVLAFAQGVSLKVVRDASFSPAGDLFLAWSHERLETIKVEPNFSYDPMGFSELESVYGSEITRSPRGILVGCDEFGPFTVGCRDTLARFEDATYPGFDASDYANFDAVAVDPATEDIYYIHIPSNKLMRLPVDTLLATGPPVEVATLAADEATGASGMVVDDADGSVFILVDTDDTRSIVKVTAGGVKSTEIDFFVARGAGDAAGRQNDLAIDREFRFLFTIDRLNDVLLLYDIVQQQLSVMTANPANTDAEALSTATSAEERLGLVVLPESGLP